MKTLLLTLVTFLTACSSLPLPTNATTGDKWKATGSLIAKRVASIAIQTVLNAAVSQNDSSNKQNFLWSAATGLETQWPNAVNSDDIANIVRIWTPQNPNVQHWEQLASKIADQYNAAHPQNTADKKAVVTAIVGGLRAAASTPAK